MISEKIENLLNDGKGILMLDTEFAARVYTPAPGLNASGAQA